MAAISNLVVRVYADRMGRGPTKVRSYFDEDVVVCLMEDAMTRAEHSLFDGGEGGNVTQARGIHQEAMRMELSAGVAGLTGRRVRSMISGHSLAPDIAACVFVLDGGETKRNRQVPAS